MTANLGSSLDTSEVIRLYNSGLSSIHVAAALGCCSRTILVRLRDAGVEVRGKGKVKTWKSGHPPSWKGDRASYSAFHYRVSAARGRPSRCEVCGRTDDGVAYDWANLTGNYADVADYQRMCRPCHRRYDHRRRKSYADGLLPDAIGDAVAGYARAQREIVALQARNWQDATA